MFCPHCGNSVPKLSGYCDHCGRDLGAIPMAGRTPVWKWIILGCVVVALAMIGSCIYTANNALDNLEQTFGDLQDGFDDEGEVMDGMGQLMLDRYAAKPRIFLRALQKKDYTAALAQIHPDSKEDVTIDNVREVMEAAGVADFNSFEIDGFGHFTDKLPYVTAILYTPDGEEAGVFLDLMLHEGIWMVEDMEFD